jgi:hypothetical protein
MSPRQPSSDSEMVHVNGPAENQLTQSDLIQQLTNMMDIYPNDGPEVEALMPNAAMVPWCQVQADAEYWICSTGFGGSAEPRRFTIKEIIHFADGGAMIFTTNPMWAFGVGASCESAVGPRNRFWSVALSQT